MIRLSQDRIHCLVPMNKAVLGGFHEKSGVFSSDERLSLSEEELSSTHLITNKYQIISSVSRKY